MDPNQVHQRTLRKPKRFRITFTTEQINYLEEQFKKFPYISQEHRREVATFLKMDERPIKIWFQNRRMKEKKSYKESDYETSNDNPQAVNANQLYNGAMPSTNDQFRFSLPILASTKDDTAIPNTDRHKLNNNVQEIRKIDTLLENNEGPSSHTHPKPNYYKKVNNHEHIPLSYIQHPSLPSYISTKNMSSTSEPSTSAEFSINLCKRYRQETAASNSTVFDNAASQSQNVKQLIQNPPSNKVTHHYKVPKGLSESEPSTSFYSPSQPPKQFNFSSPAYYPFMPSIYTPPYMSPDGVLWKPVNIMPVLTPKTRDTIPRPPEPRNEQNKNCGCDCHKRVQSTPMTISRSLEKSNAQNENNSPDQSNSP